MSRICVRCKDEQNWVPHKNLVCENCDKELEESLITSRAWQQLKKVLKEEIDD